MGSKPTTDEVLDAILMNPGDIALETDVCYIESVALFATYEDGAYDLLQDGDLERYLFREVRRLKIEGIISRVDVSDGLVKGLRRILVHNTENRIRDVVSPYIALEGGLVMDSSKDFATSPWDQGKHAFIKIPYTKEQIASAECPKFQAFLRSILTQEDGITVDSDLVDWMQLFFGNLILPSLSCQAVTFFVGERAANGKSTLMDVVQEMIGQKYISAMSMEELSRNNFAVGALRGKRLNVGEEEESKFVSSALFKKLISGELVDADVKYGGRVQFRNRAKFVFLTNSSPSFKDYDRGTRRRFFLVPFHHSFENDPNRRERGELVADLLSELPGIWRWSIEGARRLIALNYVLPRTVSMAHLQDEFEQILKSSFEFSFENYLFSIEYSEDSISIDAIYRQYVAWCAYVGCQPMKRHNFVTDLMRRFQEDGLVKKQRRDGDKRIWCFYGLRPKKGTGSFLETVYYPDSHDTPKTDRTFDRD